MEPPPLAVVLLDQTAVQYKEVVLFERSFGIISAGGLFPVAATNDVV
jgi:hypothetical protein